jgi:hypothetical protein
VRVVLVLALAAVAGCGTRSQAVGGAAAPLTASGGPRVSTTPPSRTPAGGTQSPTPTPPAPVPTEFTTARMTGFGLTITFPVPADWQRSTAGSSDALSRTDAKVGDDLLLRVDLTDRGPGTAREVAERVEAGGRANRPNYERLGITDVPGVGDDAVDWRFTFDLAGRPVQVIDRQIVAGTGSVAVYLRAPVEFYGHYLPVWQRTAEGLTIRTS